MRRFILCAFVVVLLRFSAAEDESHNQDESNSMIPVVDGRMMPSNMCVKDDILTDATEKMNDDLVSFGITDKHAMEFSDWILSDVVIATNSSEDILCFPPDRTDEMGTRLGNIISQDIAGERPSKRGRSLDDLDLIEDSAAMLLRQSDNDDSNNDDSNDKNFMSSFSKNNPFSFGNLKKSDKDPIKKECCECPANHYAWKMKKGSNGKCSKGPCCPSLCRTLERLAGALSAARFPCCKKAHRKCTEKDRKVTLLMQISKRKKEFKFDLDFIKNEGKKGEE